MQVHPVFGQSPSFIEAEGVDAAADVDRSRTDAEDAVIAFEAMLRKDDAAGHRRRQSRRNDDCDEIEHVHNYVAGITFTAGYL